MISGLYKYKCYYYDWPDKGLVITSRSGSNCYLNPAMRQFFKKLVFSNSILKTSYRYENEFQVLPIDMSGKPQSPYAKHFPLFLEYTMDVDPNIKEDIIELQTQRINKEKEILNLLSCLTNHRFYNYDTSMMGWGIKFPCKPNEEMTKEEWDEYNGQESCLFLGGYIYHGLKEDLRIEDFTDYYLKAICKESSTHEYYTDNPIDDYEHEVSFPNTLFSALHYYYELSPETRKKVDSCVYLACDGMDISDNKRTLAFLSYISAIEGLVNLEVDDNEIQFECGSCKTIKASPYTCPKCGRPIWGISQKFNNFLSKFVAGSEKSKKVYREIYNLRSKITHTGKLFQSDYEMSFDDDRREKDYEDWLMRLKTLQLFRISLNSWLRYPDKKKS